MSKESEGRPLTPDGECEHVTARINRAAEALRDWVRDHSRLSWDSPRSDYQEAVRAALASLKPESGS